MPVIHEYVPSSQKDGFYIYAMHNGQNVTYQVTESARRIFERLNYREGTELTGEMFFTLHRLGLIYTNKSGVEPPTSFDDLTSLGETPKYDETNRKRFFESILADGKLAKAELKDLNRYLVRQNITPNPDQSASDPTPVTTEDWRPNVPDGVTTYRGTVNFFNDTGGYGFIDSPHFEQDTFYHMEDLGGPDIFEGSMVEFTRKETSEGPRAPQVRVVTDANRDNTDFPKPSLDTNSPSESSQVTELPDKSFNVTFLGTGRYWPTQQRLPPALLIQYDSDSLLFDVGEGAQRRLNMMEEFPELDLILLTSTERDFIGGLGSLLCGMSLRGRTNLLTILVPELGVECVESIVEVYGRYDYPIKVVPATGGVVYKSDMYEVEAWNTDRDRTVCGYILKEIVKKGEFDESRAKELGISKESDLNRLREGANVMTDEGIEINPYEALSDSGLGRRVVYTGPLKKFDSITPDAEGANVWIHDSGYSQPAHITEDSGENSLGRAAGRTANMGNVEQLILTNIPPHAEDDMQSVVQNAEAEFDGDVKLAADNGVVTLSCSQPTQAPERPTTPALGPVVPFSELEEGMYIQLRIDRSKSPNKGLSADGSIHVFDGAEHVGERVVVRIFSLKSGHAIATVNLPSSDEPVYRYRQHARSKTTRPQSQRTSSSPYRRSGNNPNPFKRGNSRSHNIVRKKH
jgi:ribonuclease Z